MFCNRCGTPLTSDLRCPTCGTIYGNRSTAHLKSYEKPMAVIITFVVYGLVYFVCGIRNFLSIGNLVDYFKGYPTGGLLLCFSYFAPILMLLLLGVTCLNYGKKSSKLRNTLWCSQLVLLIYFSLMFVHFGLMELFELYRTTSSDISRSSDFSMFLTFFVIGLLVIVLYIIWLCRCRTKRQLIRPMAVLPILGAFVTLVCLLNCSGLYSLIFLCVVAVLFFAAIVILIQKNSLLFLIAALALAVFSVMVLSVDWDWLIYELAKPFIFCTNWLMLYGYLSQIMDKEEAFTLCMRQSV